MGRSGFSVIMFCCTLALAIVLHISCGTIDDGKTKSANPILVSDSAFLRNYIADINLDTILSLGKGKVRAIHSLDTSRYYLLPDKYFHGRKLSGSKIYYTSTKVTFLNETGVPIRELTITNESFRKHLSEGDAQINEYGVLLFPEIALKDKEVMISYSFSIPFTDLGKSVNATCSEEGAEFRVE